MDFETHYRVDPLPFSITILSVVLPHDNGVGKPPELQSKLMVSIDRGELRPNRPSKRGEVIP